MTDRTAPLGATAWRLDAVLTPGFFRLALAAAVVVSHVSRFDIGRLGVMLFFYLSGYWIARIWAEKFGPGRLFRFYAARYLRIAPLFLLITVAAALCLRKPLHLENFTLLGVASTGRDPTGVSWSLDVELQFYLLFPLLAVGIARAPAWASLALAGAAMAAGFWMDQALHLATVAKYLPAFVLGSLTYGKAWKPSVRAAHLSLAGFVLVTAVTALFTPFFLKGLKQPFDHDIYALAWMAPLLPYVAHSLGRRSSALDRHAGNLSYPLYLIHFPVIGLMVSHFGTGMPVKVAAAALALILAVLVYRFVDRPVDAARVRLTERTG